MTDSNDHDNDERRLIARASVARARVEDDVEQLAQQLEPAQLKERALDAAESSLKSLARRALRRLAQSPPLVLSYVRKHPVTGVAVLFAATTVGWRLMRRYQA